MCGVLTIRYDERATLCASHDTCCNTKMANNVHRKVDEKRPKRLC